MKTTLLALVTCAAAAAQNHSLVPNLLVNGGFDASQFSIAPWVPRPNDPPSSARLTFADFDGDGVPSQVFEFGGGSIEQPIAPLSTSQTYFFCSDGGYKRVATLSTTVSVLIPGMQIQYLGNNSTGGGARLGARSKHCFALTATRSPTGPGVLNLHAQGNATLDNVELREVQAGSLVVVEADLKDNGPTIAEHTVTFRVEAGLGNPAVLLVSPATAGITIPGLVGTVLIDPVQAITVDAALNPIGDILPLAITFRESVIPSGLAALYWQPFVLDVAAGVVRAADIALKWSYQR